MKLGRTPFTLSLMLWIPLQAQEAPDRWLPHYTLDGGSFATEINLINTDFEAGHEVRLVPFGSDGTQLTSLIRTTETAPGQRLALSRGELEWTGQPVSHVRVEADEAVRVSGTFRANLEGAMPADVTAETQTAAVIRFVPVGGDGWFDGVVATNIGEEAGTIIATAHDPQGNTLRTAQAAVPPGGKWLDVLGNLFGEELNGDGYVEIRAEPAMLFLVLRGSLGNQQPAVLTQVQPDRFFTQPSALSFNNQVSRIMQRKCSFCHHTGGIGPFPTTAYSDVFLMRNFIYRNVDSNEMPPWRASANCAPLMDSQALDPAERTMLLNWILEGAEEGPAERAPEIPAFENNEWKLGAPDQVLQYDEPFYFNPGPDVYRCYPMAVNNPVPVQLSAVEILPDNLEIVHHVLVFADTGPNGFTLDSMDDGPGYSCFGGTGTGAFRLIGGWAPGMEPNVMPEDVGMTLAPYTNLIVQIHYHFSSSPGPDHSKIGLFFSQTPREKELLLLPLVNQNFVIPAGAKQFPVTQAFHLPAFIDVDLYLVAPHMHLLGQTISAQATFPDGSEMCLIDVPSWDFDWQRFYQYPNPIHIPGGSTISMLCTYDNSTENIYNPNSPPKDVGWGEATTDEMALVFFGVVSPLILPKDAPPQPGKWRWPFEVTPLGNE